MNSIEFLEERLNDIERKFEGYRLPTGEEHTIVSMLLVMRTALDLQKKWPVLIRTPAKMELSPMDDFDPSSITMRMTEQIAWVEHEEYIKTFGEEPPTNPMVQEMLRMFVTHPDFNPEWLP